MKVHVYKLHLTNQGYPKGFIDEGICQAKECDRSELLARKHQKKIMIFFHLCIPIINEKFIKINNILVDDQLTKEIYKDVKFVDSILCPKKL